MTARVLSVMGRLTASWIALALLAIVTPRAEGVVLFQDGFDYPDGNLVTSPANGEWTAISAPGETPVQVASGQIKLTQLNVPDVGEEDVAHPLSQALAADGTFYYAFDLSVEQIPEQGALNQAYFAHFSASATNGAFMTRTFLRSPATGITGDYTLGVRTNDSTSPVIFDTIGLTYGQTYRVVGSYEFNTGKSTLWLDPLSIESASVSDSPTDVDDTMVAIDRMNFRQGGSSGDSIQTIDNVIVATTFAEVIGEVDPPPTENADFNGDGIVNLADYTVWRDNLGGTGPSGDADGNELVDELDYGIWKAQFGDNVPLLGGLTGSASVPEPTSITAICLAAGILLVGSRRAQR